MTTEPLSDSSEPNRTMWIGTPPTLLQRFGRRACKRLGHKPSEERSLFIGRWLPPAAPEGVEAVRVCTRCGETLFYGESARSLLNLGSGGG